MFFAFPELPGMLLAAALASSPLSAASPTATPPPPSIAIPASGWRYEVSVGPKARDLWIEAGFAAGFPGRYSVDKGAEPFVQQVELKVGNGWQQVTGGEFWKLPQCREQGCVIRYHFNLAGAAARLHDIDTVTGQDDAYFATPSNWLLRPWECPPGAKARIHVTTPPGLNFLSGIFPTADGEQNSYESEVSDLENAAYSAFGAFRRYRFDELGAGIELAISPADFKATDGQMIEWARRAVKTMGSYFGRFATPRLALFVMPARGNGVWFGTTMGSGGAGIIVMIGRDADEKALKEDWVLDHELVHVSWPFLPRKHRWMGEGLATYFEPIARARMGRYDRDGVWLNFMLQMPNGLPERGDEGLDNTHTWGRTYWGGALFSLLADVRIRERTGNRLGLEDALRALVKAGGNIAVHWDVERTLKAADQALGVEVLLDLYREMANKPVEVDLPGLWKRLGLKLEGRTVIYDDKAPLASIRKSITDSR